MDEERKLQIHNVTHPISYNIFLAIVVEVPHDEGCPGKQ